MSTVGSSVLGPWGAAIGGIVGAGVGLFGGLKAGKERRKMDEYLQQQQNENKAWYNANALSDYTQRADAQNLIRNMRENLAKRDKSNANMSVVSGATPEQQAVAKEQSNQVISDVYGNLGAMGQQWKDNITNRYLSRKESLGNQQLGTMDARAQNWETLMNNGISGMANSFKNLSFGAGNNTPAAPPAIQAGTPQVSVPQYQAPDTLQKIDWSQYGY
jgi:gas vesicle protein